MAEIGDTYGWILLKKNLASQAVGVFEELTKRVPANSTYHYHLAKAYAQLADTGKASDSASRRLPCGGSSSILATS